MEAFIRKYMRDGISTDKSQFPITDKVSIPARDVVALLTVEKRGWLSTWYESVAVTGTRDNYKYHKMSRNIEDVIDLSFMHDKSRYFWYDEVYISFSLIQKKDKIIKLPQIFVEDTVQSLNYIYETRDKHTIIRVYDTEITHKNVTISAYGRDPEICFDFLGVSTL